MLYVPKIDDHLKILADEEVEDFIDINFSEYRGKYYKRRIKS